MKKIIGAVFVLFILSSGLFADTIILKDEQKFEADVISFDTYYLTVKLPNGVQTSIPWGEVRYIKHTTTPSSWLEEEYMSADDAEVSSLITPLYKDDAFQKAIFPGLVLHGAGHFYAKDQNTGLSLMSAEIVSLIIMGLSVQQFFAPAEPGYDYGVTKAVFISGVTIFSLSWLWDIIFAPQAVEKYNSEHEFLINALPGGNQ